MTGYDEALKFLESEIGEYKKYIEDPSLYEKSPGYDFLMGEGTKALERGASSKGMQLSGAEGKALQRYGQGLASQDYGNFLSRYGDYLNQYRTGVLSGYGEQTGMGERAATGSAGLASRYGQQMSQSHLASGQAQAAKVVMRRALLARRAPGYCCSETTVMKLERLV